MTILKSINVHVKTAVATFWATLGIIWARTNKMKSRGLVVMGDDSCLRGRGFKSRYHILDGHFSHWFVVKMVLFA